MCIDIRPDLVDFIKNGSSTASTDTNNTVVQILRRGHDDPEYSPEKPEYGPELPEHNDQSQLPNEDSYENDVPSDDYYEHDVSDFDSDDEEKPIPHPSHSYNAGKPHGRPGKTTSAYAPPPTTRVTRKPTHNAAKPTHAAGKPHSAMGKTTPTAAKPSHTAEKPKHEGAPAGTPGSKKPSAAPEEPKVIYHEAPVSDKPMPYIEFDESECIDCKEGDECYVSYPDPHPDRCLTNVL